MIRILQNAIDFETFLSNKFRHEGKKAPGSEFVDERIVRTGDAVTIDVGSAADVRQKHQMLAKIQEVKEKSSEQGRPQQRLRGKTHMSSHIYRFVGCISECFEPYLNSYSQNEEK